MTIESERTGSSVLMSLSGRLDTATAPLLERKLNQWGSEITELVLDFTNISYISSMGLRVLLQTQKAMKAAGQKFQIQNIPVSIREVFEVTGFINLMMQEEKFVIIRKEESGQITLSLIGDMEETNTGSLKAELVQIQEAWRDRDEALTVILDMERLHYLNHQASMELKQIIQASAWERRSLSLQNVSAEIFNALRAGGLDSRLISDAGVA
jgi:anti-sigma B factor antagonist